MYPFPNGPTLALFAGALVAPAGLSLLFLRSGPGRWTRWAAWTLIALGIPAGLLVADREPAGTRMILFSVVAFFGLKPLVTAETRLAGRPLPGPAPYLAFHFLWAGMRPSAFVEPWGPARRGAGRLVIEGAAFGAAGVGLLLAARGLAAHGTPARLASLIALAGLFLALPFGAFRSVAGLWRRLGIAVGPPMDAPHRARSLTEFWGRRWNRPFSEMGQLALHRPLRRRFGPGLAAFAVFLLSGLLHEVVLSLPARGGYGLPTAYFALQGGLVALERRMGLGRPGIRPAWGRAWTIAAVLLPAPVLFHPAFLDACVRPLLGID